jgi:glycosyltransferase A (GT-A) superfamily protein (DUF2064 family)
VVIKFKNYSPGKKQPRSSVKVGREDAAELASQLQQLSHDIRKDKYISKEKHVSSNDEANQVSV